MNVSQEIYETDRAIDELVAALDYCDNTGNPWAFIRKETIEKALSVLRAELNKLSEMTE